MGAGRQGGGSREKRGWEQGEEGVGDLECQGAKFLSILIILLYRKEDMS